MNKLNQLATTNFNYMKQCYFGTDKPVESTTTSAILEHSDIIEHGFHEMRTPTERIITGVCNFDRLFTEYEGKNIRLGLRAKDIMMLGGMSGNGKTTVAMSLYSSLYKTGQNPLFVSLDMSTDRVWDAFRKCTIGFKAPATEMIDLIAEMGGYKPRIISLRGRIKISQLDIYLSTNPHKIVIIDYIIYLLPEKQTTKDSDRYQCIFDELKILVEKHNCALIILTQSNEYGINKSGKPTISNIYGGQEVRSNVDHVLALYQPAKYNKKIPAQYRNITEIIVLKGRRDTNQDSIYLNYINGMAVELSDIEANKYELVVNNAKNN